ncbi:MAG: plasma-membrane proton-efflux P-type ATPase [Candidatus Omnitrophica bacterium]|nr:plasma-membrane proton-efflux P-type ATPase [Candidatus Omnitrophota bacterium]
MNFKTKNTSEYKKISLEDIFKSLETSSDGLTGEEAKHRLGVFGYNEIIEKKVNSFYEFILRYWGPMPWLLEVAIILSFIVEHSLEGIIIFALLTINAIIGQVHSRGSQKAIEFLKKKLAIMAKVLRDGKWIVKEAREIVPGDIVTIKLGDIIPVDAKILNGDISVDQSSLTGESLPVHASQSDIVYSGSVVKYGEAKCVVVNTGGNTYFGKTAELVKIAKPKSHQEEVMLAIVKYMMYVGIAALIVVLIFGFLINIHEDTITILTLAVIFLMGAVPVALPAVLTIVQSAGAMELSKKGTLVTKLDSLEDAASINVLCLDKTGTLTQNKLSVTDSIPFYDYKKEDVIISSVMASRAEGMDLIDLAIIESLKNMGLNIPPGYKQISYIPFNPSIKRTEAIVEINGRKTKIIKGAFRIIMSLCHQIDEETIKKSSKIMEEFSLKGYRTIAVARSENGNMDNLKFVGLLALSDPPRPDSQNMIEEAKKLGIKVIMLTGDNIEIAKEVARNVSIGDRIVSLTDIEDLNAEEQIKILDESDGIAEIYPEDKYKVVKLLQSKGYMVGMTGDGVNDAPALKQAEMGIAVSNSTDVAKASASVVLTEQGLNQIIDAIKISRKTYQRMLSWVINKIIKVIEFTGFLVISFLWLHNIVISLLGMSLIIFANDFITMSLATDNVQHTPNPNIWNIKNITIVSLVPAFILIAGDIILLLIGIKIFSLGFNQLRTLVLLTLVFDSQYKILVVRERGHFWESKPGKQLFFASISVLILFVFLGMYWRTIYPLMPYQVLTILILSALYTFSIDFPKYKLCKRFNL